MRVMCWNMNSQDAGWELVRELSPDVALLSEVRSVPDDVTVIDCRLPYYCTTSSQGGGFNPRVLIAACLASS
jgi:hypothetical protein